MQKAKVEGAEGNKVHKCFTSFQHLPTILFNFVSQGRNEKSLLYSGTMVWKEEPKGRGGRKRCKRECVRNGFVWFTQRQKHYTTDYGRGKGMSFFWIFGCCVVLLVVKLFTLAKNTRDL